MSKTVDVRLCVVCLWPCYGMLGILVTRPFVSVLFIDIQPYNLLRFDWRTVNYKLLMLMTGLMCLHSFIVIPIAFFVYSSATLSVLQYSPSIFH
jgi:hypothetical protein